MAMGRLIKILFLIAVAVGIGVAVSRALDQKRVFMEMTEEEQRAFLADKLGSRVPPEKLAKIEDAIVGKTKAKIET
jgi:hypothetical protein